MDRPTAQVMQALQEIELAAEDVLTDRHHIVDLDRKRNETRVALRALQKEKRDAKSYVCFGDMFIKMPNTKTKSMLEKDFDALDSEVNETRIKLKDKVGKLRDLENKDDIKGFGLKALSAEESRSLQNILY